MQSLSSDRADTHVDLSFHWSHIPHCWFDRDTVKFWFEKICSIRRHENVSLINEPRHEKTCIRGFQPGPTYSKMRWLEAWNFGFRK